MGLLANEMLGDNFKKEQCISDFDALLLTTPTAKAVGFLCT